MVLTYIDLAVLHTLQVLDEHKLRTLTESQEGKIINQ
jgi:hypothetical protein